MTDKSSFTPDEWKLLLESVMMASIAVTAAEPSGLWGLLKESFAGFFADEALTRGAAISFYTITSIGPVLFIVVAIAGIAFGEEAATELLPRNLPV